MTPNHTAQSVEDILADFDSTFGYLNSRHTNKQWNHYKDWLRTTLTTRDEAVRREVRKLCQQIARECFYEHNPARHGNTVDDAYIRVVDALTTPSNPIVHE